MIRTFIGIELDPDLCRELQEEIAYLKSHAPAVRWASPDTLHITLKFLGDVPEKDLPDVFRAADAAAGELEAVTAEVAGIGALPNLRHPRVVLADIKAGREELVRIAKGVDAAFAEIGYPPEKRPFQPHVTLGRVKEPRDAEGLEPLLADGANTSFGLLDVGELVVFMSEKRRYGTVYAPMHRVPLL